MDRLSASGSVCRPPAGDEVDAAPQPNQSERDEAGVAVEPDLHAEVEGGFWLDVTAPAVDIGADVGESLSGQCQVAVAEGWKEELANWCVNWTGGWPLSPPRRGKARCPTPRAPRTCAHDCRRFGHTIARPTQKKEIPGARCLGPWRPSAFPIGVARVEEDVVDADRAGNQYGALVAIALEEQDRQTNWCDGKLRRQRQQSAVLAEQDLTQRSQTRQADAKNTVSHALVALFARVGQVERRSEARILKRHQDRGAGERAACESSEHAQRAGASERPRMNEGKPSQQHGRHRGRELRNRRPPGAESDNCAEAPVSRFAGPADAHGRREREHQARRRQGVTDEERRERPDRRRQTE